MNPEVPIEARQTEVELAVAKLRAELLQLTLRVRELEDIYTQERFARETRLDNATNMAVQMLLDKAKKTVSK